MRPSSARIHAPTTAANNSLCSDHFVRIPLPPPLLSFPGLILLHTSIDWVQNIATATTTWGDIGDWDVSGVKNFYQAFRTGRNQANNGWTENGNPKAAFFTGVGLEKWKTNSVTSLSATFAEAIVFNADLSKWRVSKVTTMFYTFHKAKAFNADLSSWDVRSVVKANMNPAAKAKLRNIGMNGMFDINNALTSCNTRGIADSWDDVEAFNQQAKGGRFATAWAGNSCAGATRTLNDAQFKLATWGTFGKYGCSVKVSVNGRLKCMI